MSPNLRIYSIPRQHSGDSILEPPSSSTSPSFSFLSGGGQELRQTTGSERAYSAVPVSTTHEIKQILSSRAVFSSVILDVLGELKNCQAMTRVMAPVTVLRCVS